MLPPLHELFRDSSDAFASRPLHMGQDVRPGVLEVRPLSSSPATCKVPGDFLQQDWQVAACHESCCIEAGSLEGFYASQKGLLSHAVGALIAILTAAASLLLCRLCKP